jgi:hypothetical protein
MYAEKSSDLGNSPGGYVMASVSGLSDVAIIHTKGKMNTTAPTHSVTHIRARAYRFSTA